MVVELSRFDQDVRGTLTQFIAREGRAPSHATVSDTLGCSISEVEASLDRLHATHSLLLHPHVRRVWVVHPFALTAGSCWVQTPDRGYWANCLYCGLGIAAALGSDAVISTRIGGEGEAIQVEVSGGAVVRGAELLFHLSTPVARWWENVIAACASFQPFRSVNDVDAWCARHDLPLGHVMNMEQLVAFAGDWYGDYVQKPWRKRTPDETRSLFASHGFVSPFWEIG